MIKVLLTGANGQIGSEIKLAAPDFVRVLSCDKHSLDITSKDAIKTFFAEYHPDYVINTAAYTAVDEAEKEAMLAYEVNTVGVEHLAYECHAASIPLIHISTDYIFNGIHNKPYIETDIAAPLSVYGKSKWEGEQTVRRVLTQHIILRTSWVFGYFGNNFVKTILRLAKDQPILRVVSDQYGCPTAATDVAKVIWHIISQISQQASENTPWGTYHFTNVHEVSWYDFTKKILHIAEQYTTLAAKDVIAISTAEYPTLAQRPAYSVLNCQKITDDFNITQGSWEVALEELVRLLCAKKPNVPSIC